MSEPENIVLLQLRLIREELTTIGNDMRDVRDRMDSFDKHMQGFFNEIIRHSTRLTVRDGRLDRLEQRAASVDES